MPIRRVYREQAEGTFDVDLGQLIIFPYVEYDNNQLLYVRLHSCDGIPSFTLLLERYDKSVMSCHLSC